MTILQQMFEAPWFTKLMRTLLWTTIIIPCACTNTYLDEDIWSSQVSKYNSKDDHKAMAMDMTTYHNYMVWSRDDETSAQNDAMNDCKAAHRNCKLVASDGNLHYDVSSEFRSAHTDWMAVTTQVLTLGTAAASGYAAGMSGGSSVPTSSGGGNSYGSGGSNCQQYLDLANQCKTRQDNMASLTPMIQDGTSGAGGQDTQFQACYNNYMGGYNACKAAE
ncbi:MAG: hypothetical protein QOK29_4750 [Rhodospirillaceae bacterium]|jgi:uncharacterized membrane protein YgcG|nr:hypothetical protein [Rhodospirillaceae bacterium]